MATRAVAPGRVNLIGDHTDYQDGWCLPLAIDRAVAVTFSRRADAIVHVTSADASGTAAERPFATHGAVEVAADGTTGPALVEPPWGRTVAGVVRALAQRGRPPAGFDAHITSTVPVGSGLSSSAAVEVGLALAATEVAGFGIDTLDLARAAQEAEHLATGVPCGVLDQMASVFGRAGHALLLDCRALTVDPIPIPDDARLTVVHSGLPRTLETSAYAERRAACEAAATRIGVQALRDARLDQVGDDPFARHVVTENARTLECADALRARDLERVGHLMQASHASLRDDFAVATPELDLLVELALEGGALGARLTGAGFGGCVVALSRAPLDPSVAERYRAATGLEPRVFEVRASDGAHVVEE